ncbi:GATA transcription factor 2 [Cocos nucifera]|nr:GATA transcription factor 2 [Cocos nucifera]
MDQQDMDLYQNLPASGGLPAKGPSVASSTFEDFLPGGLTEGEDVSLEWLSIFVEDCLSSTTSYNSQNLPPPTRITNSPQLQTPAPYSKPPPPQTPKPSFHVLEAPSKYRSKRRKTTPKSHPHDQNYTLHVIPSDPPLLHQTHWLADSELIFPKKEQEDKPSEPTLVGGEEGEEVKMGKDGAMVQPRRCTHCLSQKTPQWRAGPLGPKTLCNACGVRFKSGRLLPEYRPAKSPTFVSYKHSNSHKKVMEMRMAILSSHSS